MNKFWNIKILYQVRFLLIDALTGYGIYRAYRSKNRIFDSPYSKFFFWKNRSHYNFFLYCFVSYRLVWSSGGFFCSDRSVLLRNKFSLTTLLLYLWNLHDDSCYLWNSRSKCSELGCFSGTILTPLPFFPGELS